MSVGQGVHITLNKQLLKEAGKAATTPPQFLSPSSQWHHTDILPSTSCWPSSIASPLPQKLHTLWARSSAGTLLASSSSAQGVDRGAKHPCSSCHALVNYLSLWLRLKPYLKWISLETMGIHWTKGCVF